MAAQIKLVERYDFTGDGSSLSLYANEAGFSLARGGWLPDIAGDDDARIAETLTLMVEGSSHDDLASKLQSLDEKIEEIGRYVNETIERYGIWLRTQLADETGARQALVTKMRGKVGNSLFGPPVSPGNFLREYRLALERMPWWERTSHVVYNVSGVNCLGGTSDYTTYGGSPGVVVGNKLARIAQLSFKGASGGGGPLYEFWLGFRTDRFGDRANFVPAWNCTWGTLANNTTSVTDATANAGYKAQCTFGDTSLLPRATIAVEDVTTNYTDQRGSFTILLRAKVGSATTCRVRLLSGLESASDWQTRSRHVITSTNWFLYPLGSVSIPYGRGHVTSSSFFRKCALRIEAERVSGSGNLDLDCLLLIPNNEGFMHSTGGVVQYVAADTRPAYINEVPEGTIVGRAYSGGFPVSSVTVEPQGWGLPIGNGILVLAGQRATVQNKDDYVNLTVQIYPRWRTLRGAE